MKIKLLYCYEDREDTPWVIIDPPNNLPELLKEWNDLDAQFAAKLSEPNDNPLEGWKPVNEWLADKGVNIVEPDSEINLTDYPADTR